MLDWDSQVDLKGILNTNGKSYTIPKNGVLTVSSYNSKSVEKDTYFYLNSSNYGSDVISHRGISDYAADATQLIVSAGDILTIRAMSDRAFRVFLYIPFK